MGSGGSLEGHLPGSPALALGARARLAPAGLRLGALRHSIRRVERLRPSGEHTRLEMARAWRGLAVALFVLVAQPVGVSASCASNEECQGSHEECQGYKPGNPNGTPPGLPATPGTCACTGGWTSGTGSNCDVDPCTGYDCGHGSCHDNKQCSCNSGWEGNRCGNRISCGPAPSPAHTTGCSGAKVFQDTCQATCDAGWTGGTSQATFTCGANGKYTGSLTCQKISCGQAPSPPHSSGCSGSKKFLETCNATCDDGWTASTPLSVEFGCKADKSYSGSALTCKNVNCGPLKVPAHSTGCDGSVRKFHENPCAAKCESGYTKVADHTTISCEADGQKPTGKYDGSLTCEMVTCPAAAPVDKANKCSLTNFHGQGCTASCVNGYNPSGDSDFTCGANGRSSSGIWEQPSASKTFTCTPQHCNAANPVGQDPHAAGSAKGSAKGSGCPAGEFDGKSESALPGTCSLKCEDGYDPSDQQVPYTCGADGLWSGGSLTCTGKLCEGRPVITTDPDGKVNNHPIETNPLNNGSATNPCSGSGCSKAGHFPSTLEIVDDPAADDPACTQHTGQRGTFLRGGNIWKCSTGGQYLDGKPQNFDPELPLKCVPCPPVHGQVYGMPHCDNEDPKSITCEKDPDHPWETPEAECATGHCDPGYINTGESGCLQRKCDPILHALSVGTNQSSTAGSDQATCTMMQESGTSRKKVCDKVDYSASTTAEYKCNTGYKTVDSTRMSTNKTGPVFNTILTCNIDGKWLPAEPEETICGACCEGSDGLRGIETCSDGLKYFRNDKKVCTGCPKDLPPLKWWHYIVVVVVTAASIGILFLFAGLLKKMGTVIGPIMSLITFMQIADLQKTLQREDGCVINIGGLHSLCSDGALGASNLDVSILQSQTSWIGKFITAYGNPQCLFDFKYDTQWAAVVFSPLVLALVLILLLGLRIVLAVLANWWLPPWARPEQGVNTAIEIKFKLPCSTEVQVLQLIDVDTEDETTSKPPCGWSKLSTCITLVMLPFWVLPLLMWWLLWTLLTCCGKFDSCFCNIPSPGRRSQCYPDLENHGLMNWRGLEKIAKWFAEIDVEELLYRVFSMQLVYMWSAYVYLIKWTIAPFYCKGDPGHDFMIANPAVACNDDHVSANPLRWHSFNKLWWLSVVFTFVWIAGIPATFFYILHNAKHSQSEDGGERSRLKDREFTKRFGFMTTKMREESICYSWDVVILLRKGLLVILGQQCSTDLATFSYLSLLVMIVAGFLQTYFQPFALDDANFVESLFLVSSCLLFLLQLYEKQHVVDDSNSDDSNSRELFKDFVSVVIAVTVIGTIFVIVGRASGALWLHSREGKKLKFNVRNQTDQTDEEKRAVQNYTEFHKRAVTKAIVGRHVLTLRGKLKDVGARRNHAKSLGLKEDLDPKSIIKQIAKTEASNHTKRLGEMSLAEVLEEADRLDEPVVGTNLTVEAQRCGITVDGEPTVETLHHTTLGVKGWLAKELADEDREMIDKSKLLLTDAWTQGEKDGVKIAECKVALAELRGFCGDRAQYEAKKLFKDAENFAGHFTAELRPQLFAKIFTQHGISAQIARAKHDRDLPGCNDTDRAFYGRLIQWLQDKQRQEAVEKERLRHFVENLRATDEKQKWYIVRKLRKWRCCPCCDARMVPACLRSCLPDSYVNLIEEAIIAVNTGQDREGPARSLSLSLNAATDAEDPVDYGGAPERLGDAFERVQLEQALAVTEHEGRPEQQTFGSRPASPARGGQMLPTSAYDEPEPEPEPYFATRHASPNNSESDSDSDSEVGSY